jgi:hypothetical protein
MSPIVFILFFFKPTGSPMHACPTTSQNLIQGKFSPQMAILFVPLRILSGCKKEECAATHEPTPSGTTTYDVQCVPKVFFSCDCC